MATNTLTSTPIVSSDGTATVAVRVTDGLSTWTVSQVSLRMPDAPAGATCNVDLNAYPVSPAIPTGDTLADSPPVTLLPSDVLTITWAGCTPGSAGQVQIWYDDGRTA
jgi:hypothetical protein